MNEDEFKMKVIEELSTLKEQMKTLLIDKRSSPVCIQNSIKKEVAINRKLIIILLSSIIGLFIKTLM